MNKERLHYWISIKKSIWRLAGYILLIPYPLFAVAVLIASELLGIAEEVWGA